MNRTTRPPFLKDSELVLEEVFRHTPIGMILTDSRRSILDVNEAICSMLGYTRAELVGRLAFDLIDPRDHAEAADQTAALVEGRISNYQATRRYISRDGEIFNVRVSASVISTREGEPVCGLAFVENITDRVAMENALRQSEARCRRVVEDQTDLVVRCLPDGTRTFVNEAYCRYNESTATALLGTSFFACMPPAEQELVRRKFAALSPSNPVITDQHWVVGPNGSMRWHEWTKRGFFDENGALVEIQSVGRDLTEQHEATERVARSEARYRRLFHSLPVAAWESDWTALVEHLLGKGIDSEQKLETALRESPSLFQEGGVRVTIVGVNPSALSMAGVATIEDFRGWLITALTPESARRYAAGIPQLMFGESKFLREELTLIRQDGQRMEIDFRVARSDHWGQEWMMFPIAVDITERKRAEEEAARHRDEMVRADRMISLGTLVSGMAHEINNPNHTIMLNMPLVREAWRDVTTLVDELAAARADLRVARIPWWESRLEVGAMLEDVESASQRIRTIVSELRGFSLDHDSGERQAVAVNEVVRSALRLLRNQIGKATKRFSLDLADEVPVATGNAGRIEQVVVNLAINACQALTNDEQFIRISTGAAGPRVFIRVCDGGCGIAQEHMRSIRNPFFTTKRAEGGTGLGLAVCDRIAAEHGGTLEFESEVGGGTTATLWLPAGSA